MPVIDFGDGKVGLGCKPRVAKPGSVAPLFSKQIPTIPETDWKEIDMTRLCPQVMDQGKTQMCTSFATVAGFHAARKQNGLGFIQLSPANLYCRINGGADDGSLLSDALKAAHSQGICRAAQVPLTDWRNGRPQGWETDAANFQVEEFFDCPRFEHIATAIRNRIVVVTAINIGRNFVITDGDGVVPTQPDYAAGGHAVLAVGMKRIRGDWHLMIQNSWGEKWGCKGFGFVHRCYWDVTPFTDAWCVRSITSYDE